MSSPFSVDNRPTYRAYSPTPVLGPGSISTKFGFTKILLGSKASGNKFFAREFGQRDVAIDAFLPGFHEPVPREDQRDSCRCCSRAPVAAMENAIPKAAMQTIFANLPSR